MEHASFLCNDFFDELLLCQESAEISLEKKKKKFIWDVKRVEGELS